MSKPAELPVRRRTRPGPALAALVTLAGLASWGLPAQAEIVGGAPGLAPMSGLSGMSGLPLASPMPGGLSSGSAAAPAAGPYHLRCWQEGRLIIDEQGVQLSRDAAPDVELLKLRNAQQQPVLLVSRAGTTCLARPGTGPTSAERPQKQP
jgi:hypothetical protein